MKGFCGECSESCGMCSDSFCNIACGGVKTWCSFGMDTCSHMCADCASFRTCQRCKEVYCCTEGAGHCRTCDQTFCRECVTFRRCDGYVPLRMQNCTEEHCVNCPDEVFVELARTCAECNKEPCDACIHMKERCSNGIRCTRCFRTSCDTWQAEKKKLMDEQLKGSRKEKGSGGV